MSASSQVPAIVATDVGLWMALPAFGPAFLIAAVFVVVIRRDRRRSAEDTEPLTPEEDASS